MLALSLYGTLVPSAIRCDAPGAVGCPGGFLGPAFAPASSGDLWFDVTMYDWGFWVVDSTTGANETNAWNVFEGWTVHVNATSLPPDASIGGTAYHGLGIELNATGQQLMSLAAPVGKWVSAAFVAPTTPYFHQHIWCTISCGPGHSSQQAYILNIIPPVNLPVASASANTTQGPAPLAVHLNGNASSGTAPYNFSWDFGDGSPAAYGPSVNHVYTLGGIYYATLTITDAKANSGRSAVTVTVLSNAPLRAALSATPSSGLAPLGTSFSTVAHGGTPPYAYTWSYGDGPAVTGPNATTHTFTAPGIYAVAVTVADSTGAITRSLASVTIRPSAGSLAITVNATASSGAVPLQTTLQASGSGGTSPYTFAWILGDGTTASGPSVSHLYNQTGSYEPTVFVTDSTGRAGIAELLVAVTPVNSGGGNDDAPAPPAAPSASSLTLRALTSPSAGAPPLATTEIVSIMGGAGANESVTWSFGDGGTGTGQVVTHTFATAGTFNVSVTATDSGGNTGTTSTTVRVGGFSMQAVLNQTSGDSPFSVAAAVTLIGGAGTYGPVTWSWGDGGQSTGYVANHTYGPNSSGNFTVRASVTDSSGVSANASVSLSVAGPPVATLTVSRPTGGGLPVPVNLTLTVTGGSGGYPSEVLWSFGDQTGTRGPPRETHLYNRTGHFLVTVETNDSVGRVAVAQAWVNLSSSVVLPHLTSGPTVWIFTGVPDPQAAALVLMGLVGATGLLFLYRKRTAPRSKSPTRSAGPGTPSPPNSSGPGLPPST